MLVLSLSIFVVHATTTTVNQPIDIPQTPLANRLNISFTIYEGEGCACVPIQGVTVRGYALDDDDQVEAVTNEEGTVLLPMQYGLTYRMEISYDQFQTVLFDFNVIDEQHFSFHLQEEDDAISLSHTLADALWIWYQARFQST